jgi:beta-fructofuranosidase
MVALDGGYFYAAKRAGDDNPRLLFGWAAAKTGDRDAGAREWGGNLALRELVRQADGSLSNTRYRSDRNSA